MIQRETARSAPHRPKSNGSSVERAPLARQAFIARPGQAWGPSDQKRALAWLAKNQPIPQERAATHDD
jgi:hypothetical protein